MTTVIANLGTGGFIKDPVLMGTTLMKYYFLGSTDFDYLHGNTIGTMGNDLAGSGNVQEDIMASMKRSLEVRFGSSFDDVVVEVNSVNKDTISLAIVYRKKDAPESRLIDLSYGVSKSDGLTELFRYNKSGGVIEYDKLQS